MSVLIKDMDMPKDDTKVVLIFSDGNVRVWGEDIDTDEWKKAVEVPTPHGDLIDRDALIKDGWLNLHKEVMWMGGYAIHELPLKNPSIPIIIEAEDGE